MENEGLGRGTRYGLGGGRFCDMDFGPHGMWRYWDVTPTVTSYKPLQGVEYPSNGWVLLDHNHLSKRGLLVITSRHNSHESERPYHCLYKASPSSVLRTQKYNWEYTQPKESLEFSF